MFNALLHSNTPKAKANNGKLNILCLLKFSRPRCFQGSNPRCSKICPVGNKDIALNKLPCADAGAF